MNKTRTLALNAERLTELTSDEMAAVNGGASWDPRECIPIRTSLSTCLIEKTYGHSLCNCGTEYCV